MNQRFLNAILQIGGDPADELWIWLVKRGPHGTSFTWGQTRSEPAGYVGICHLEEIAAEMTALSCHPTAALICYRSESWSVISSIDKEEFVH